MLEVRLVRVPLRHVRVGQRPNMRGYTSRVGGDDPSLDPIPPFETRHHTPVTAPIGDLDDLLRQPFVLLLEDPQVSIVDLVLPVRVEACADNDEVGVEFVEGG